MVDLPGGNPLLVRDYLVIFRFPKIGTVIGNEIVITRVNHPAVKAHHALKLPLFDAIQFQRGGHILPFKQDHQHRATVQS